MNTELSLFVREALAKGASRKDITSALTGAGWQAEEVHNELAGYADTDFPVPVPRRRAYTSAREAFMYLVMFLTLYISSYSFGALLFQFINRAYPDVVPYIGYVDATTSAMRWSTSALIIAFPIFLWISWLLNKVYKKDPSKRSSKVRKWLTYITLFIAAGIIIGDLIALVFNVLGGELGMRFILKVLVVGGIAGSIFGYYLMDLRKVEEKEL